MRYSKSLLERAESVGEARAYATRILTEFAPELLDRAVLMVSELVTNVVVHAHTAAELSIDLDSENVRVSVADRGGGEPHLLSPSTRDTHGRGLRIVEALSDQWGVERRRNSTKVWFLLRLR